MQIPWVPHLALNIIMSVRFLKINRFLKMGIVLLLSNAFLYLQPMFIKVRNSEIQRAINADENYVRSARRRFKSTKVPF